MAIRGMLATGVISRDYPCLRALRLFAADFTSIVMAAGVAKIVRELKLAAIRTFLVVDRLQRMMAAAHIAL
jgi:hypothetical protein